MELRAPRFRLLTAIAAAPLTGANGAAMAQSSRNVLPIPPTPFAGNIGETVASSTSAPRQAVRAPAGAPNILLFMSDDVGFGMSGTFGGPVPHGVIDGDIRHIAIDLK